MVAQVLDGEQTFLDQNGDPLSGGLVYMYFPNTTTFSNTWQDSAGTVVNTNPIVLDQAGRARIWGVGSYRQVVQDQFGNVQWDQITQAGTSANLSGDVPGDLSVGGNATIAGQLVVGNGLFVNGGETFTNRINGTDAYLSGLLAVNTIVANGGSAVTFDSPGQFGNIVINSGGVGVITGVSEYQGAIAQINDIYTDHIHAFSVGSITIDQPIFSGGIEIATNNITGVGTLGATNVTVGGNVFTNSIACNGATFVNFDCSIAVAATGGPDGITVSNGGILVNGPHVHIAAFDPTIGLTAPGTGGYGMWYNGSGLSWGSVDGNGNASGQLMAMDGGGNLNIAGSATINGDINVATGIISGVNIIPQFDTGGSVGQAGQRWGTMVTLDMIAANYITGSTEATSAPLAQACLPLVASINVKTAPHLGLAREDVANVPGAQVTAGGIEGVSNNAIVACLWKALQELNAAFNAYVAAHP